MKKYILGFLFAVSIEEASTQIKWDGEGGDGQWLNPLNWNGNIVPAATDHVIIDNSFLSGFISVSLPSGAVSITIASLTLSPSATADSILLINPSSNTAAPSVIVTGSMYLNRAACFINASGASSGNALSIGDSMHIRDGARFIQNTRTAHAAFVSRISKSPGTEHGVFEFDVPGTTSYTVSLSGRTYGRLEFNAVAAGGIKTYLSNGSTPATVNSDLLIKTGANYALDFNADLLIKDSLIVKGIFNISSSSNNNVIKVRGDLICQGLITETGTGNPTVEFCGNGIQYINASGTFANSVTVKQNNGSTLNLSTPLFLPFRLELTSGKIKSSSSSMPVLLPAATIIADSTIAGNFIDGPMQKQGLSGDGLFLFPIGNGTVQRWMKIKNGLGDVTAEFHKISPYTLSSVFGTGIDHVSRIEYWTVENSLLSSPLIELSFNDVNSGGVSDLSALRVSRLISGTWNDCGNRLTTGSAGGAGSVTSDTINALSASKNYFTLASNSSLQNPLPALAIDLVVRKESDGMRFVWKIPGDAELRAVNIQGSANAVSFTNIREFEDVLSARNAEWFYRPEAVHFSYFRIKAISKNGKEVFSKVVAAPILRTTIRPVITTQASALLLKIDAPVAASCDIFLINNLGQVILKKKAFLPAGSEVISLSTVGLPRGIYQVFGISSNLLIKPTLFYKP